jgi:hypothetical protein
LNETDPGFHPGLLTVAPPGLQIPSTPQSILSLGKLFPSRRSGRAAPGYGFATDSAVTDADPLAGGGLTCVSESLPRAESMSTAK